MSSRSSYLQHDRHEEEALAPLVHVCECNLYLVLAPLASAEITWDDDDGAARLADAGDDVVDDASSGGEVALVIAELPGTVVFHLLQQQQDLVFGCPFY